MKTTRIRHDKKRIQQELKGLRAQIQRVRTKLGFKPDYGLGEGDPAIYEWEMNLSLLRRLESQVQSLEMVLHRIEQGVYRTCKRCGKTINPARLEVLPGATLCIACAGAGQR